MLEIIKDSFNLKNKSTWLSLLFGSLLFISSLIVYKYFKVLIPAVIALSFYFYLNFNNEKLQPYVKILFVSIFVAVFLFFLHFFFNQVHSKEWDFTCFYLFGSVAKQGLNFYDPASYHQIISHLDIPFAVSEEFSKEVLDVGCLYPPPTLLLFLPLGYLPYKYALLLMYGLILLAFIGCIFFLKKGFFKNSGFAGYMVSSIILMSSSPIIWNIYLAQTLIFLLFFIFLVYAFREKAFSGIFLAISIFIKPFAVILILYFLFLKQWKFLLYFTLTCIAILLITVANFGIQPFFDYVLNNPTNRLPPWFYDEWINQSLLADLHRFFNNNIVLVKRWYYILSSLTLLVCAGVFLNLIIKKRFTDLSIVLLLSLALTIYPSGQVTYSAVHMLSIMIILKHTNNEYLKLVLLGLFFLILPVGLMSINVFLFILTIIIIYKVELINFYSKTVLKNASK